METMKKPFLIAFGVVMAIGLIVIVLRSSAPEPATVSAPATQSALGSHQTVNTQPSGSPQLAEISKTIPAPVRVEAKSPAKLVPEHAQTPVSPAEPMFVSKGKPIIDPNARLALSLVGTDPDAEAYWLDAINDPSLPPNERKDLIEDLNEDGLSDPDHPGPQDLPLIENRLSILAALANDPMDKVNADAIQEAAKDLTKMYADLTGQ
jgi:hypothetical protein